MVMAIKTPRTLLLPLSLGVAWMLMGCSLLEYPPLHWLDFQKSKPPDAYHRGVQFYRDGHYKSALTEFETVPPDHPRFKQAQEYLKKANGRVSEASTHVNAALQDQKEGELFKAKMELEEALEAYPKHRRVRMLLEALDKDIEATVDFYYDEGQEQFEQGNYEEARIAFLEVLKADPEETRVLAELPRTNQALEKKFAMEGTALFEKGDFNGAIKQLEKSYELNSADPDLVNQLANAYNVRALKYNSEEKLSLATLDLKRSLEIKPDQEEIRHQLQQIQNKLGLLEKIGP
jgi:tetratricopeptide (TPR) repeat protein